MNSIHYNYELIAAGTFDVDRCLIVKQFVKIQFLEVFALNISFMLQADVLSATFYEMVYEIDRSALLDMLSSFDLKEGRVSFSCRMLRGETDNENHTSYEIINFLGFLSKFIKFLLLNRHFVVKVKMF